MSTPTLELRNLEVAYTVRGIDREVLRSISSEILISSILVTSLYLTH